MPERESLHERLILNKEDALDLSAKAGTTSVVTGDALEQKWGTTSGKAGSRVAKAWVKKVAPPVEAALLARDTYQLATSEEARKQARDNVKKLGQEKNALIRATAGVLDPVDTLYGFSSWTKKVRQARKDAEKSALNLAKEQAVRQRMGKLLHENATREEKRRMLKRLRDEAKERTVWGFGRPKGKPKRNERSFRFADDTYEIVPR